MNMGNGIISIVDTITRLRQKRKHMVEEKDHLKFCYEAVLHYATDLLANSKQSSLYKFPSTDNMKTGHIY
jgi:protein tyrosine phosphatase